MKIKVFAFVFILPLLFPLFASAQEQQQDLLQSKVSLGGWYNDSKYLSAYASYSLVNKHENEICFSLYNWSFNSKKHEVIFGAAYCISLLKKRSKFDLFVAGELNYNYDWVNDTYRNLTIWHHGPFAGLGISPAYNISDRLSMSFEINLGYGYQWGTEYDYTLNSGVYHHSERGEYFLSYKVLKINYRF